MEPTTFKIVLTVLFGIGVVTSLLAQAINFYAFRKGLPVKVKINTTWVINSVLIYGVWNWL
jgi:hypothetical protein